MIRKFAAVCRWHKIGIVLAIMVIAMLAGTAAIEAQSQTAQPASSQTATPAQPAPAQQSSSQQAGSEEATPEETTRPVKQKPYKNWTFNVGGGANMTGGTTNKFVRSGGGTGDAGVARNFSQYFGFRADFQFDNLPLRQSALSATSSLARRSCIVRANSTPQRLFRDPVAIRSTFGGDRATRVACLSPENF